MNYIVFDLEWNQPYSNDISFMKRTKMPLTGEIIQIGAVKLNEKMDIIDHFTMFIKPQYLPRMHKHVRELTGITTHELNHGVPFKTAMQYFQKWCGDEYMLLSWGSDDILINAMEQVNSILWRMLWRISIYQRSIYLLIMPCMMQFLQLTFVRL